MAWFHQTLGDMRKAIKKKQWQKVKQIVDEHYTTFHDRGMGDSLSMTATLLKTYEEKLSVVHGILSQRGTKEARTPVGGEITTIDVMAEEAQEAIERFEKIMKRLVDDGKFQE